LTLNVQAADVEINVDDTLVTIHVNPYFLRLHFTHQLLDDDDVSSAQYDPGPGTLTATLTKANPGQVFEDLDLLSKLLAPRPTQNAPVIEVLSSNEEEDDEEELSSMTEHLTIDPEKLTREQQEILEGVLITQTFESSFVYSFIKQASENDWQMPQNLAEAEPFRITTQMHYGFLDLHSGYFKNVSYTENEINELGGDAETCSRSERRAKRVKNEESKWDEEHYLYAISDIFLYQVVLIGSIEQTLSTTR
jgi:protein SHQ1